MSARRSLVFAQFSKSLNLRMEDDAALRMLAGSVLNKDDFNVLFAGKGADALSPAPTTRRSTMA